ncbi:hypothetical protein [Boudabousia marimammalium]|uniref:Uncharacterized protein n=1 Tax=Boudabousia marimammalium TaxID=156892 RepID=A0A1Q5PMB5_9ACTO|nr:hypothetical protein [Boudabousia marimammalium]OKL48663.1 hypothetical protein BM477_05540 [Boudabousia marimammalium]
MEITLEEHNLPKITFVIDPVVRLGNRIIIYDGIAHAFKIAGPHFIVRTTKYVDWGYRDVTPNPRVRFVDDLNEFVYETPGVRGPHKTKALSTFLVWWPDLSIAEKFTEPLPALKRWLELGHPAKLLESRIERTTVEKEVIVPSADTTLNCSISFSVHDKDTRLYSGDSYFRAYRIATGYISDNLIKIHNKYTLGNFRQLGWRATSSLEINVDSTFAFGGSLHERATAETLAEEGWDGFS